MAAHPLQHAHKGIQTDHDQGQHGQGHLVAGGQHAVVDLQHVQRRREHQQVDDGREYADAPEGALVGGKGLDDLVALVGIRRLHGRRSRQHSNRATARLISGTHALVGDSPLMIDSITKGAGESRSPRNQSRQKAWLRGFSGRVKERSFIRFLLHGDQAASR